MRFELICYLFIWHGPIFQEMYQDAFQRYEADFYGFSNGDLLFEDGLINTLNTLSHYQKHLNHTMVTGRRKNFYMKRWEKWKIYFKTLTNRRANRPPGAFCFYFVTRPSFKILDVLSISGHLGKRLYIRIFKSLENNIAKCSIIAIT